MQALNEGKITFDQFLEVNANAGGLDINGKIVSQRMVGDPLALQAPIRPAASTPARAASAAIVDVVPTSTARRRRRSMRWDVDVHDGYHSAVMRARLLKYNGSAANHVMLTAASHGRVRPIPAPSARR